MSALVWVSSVKQPAAVGHVPTGHKPWILNARSQSVPHLSQIASEILPLVKMYLLSKTWASPASLVVYGFFMAFIPSVGNKKLIQCSISRIFATCLRLSICLYTTDKAAASGAIKWRNRHVSNRVAPKEGLSGTAFPTKFWMLFRYVTCHPVFPSNWNLGSVL